MRRIFTFIATLFVCGAFSLGALAQSEPKKNPFGMPLPPGQTTSQPPQAAERSVMRDAWSWMLYQQQRLNREMAAAVRQMKSGNVIDATLLLALIGFTYGVLHAAGPGHGKAVISSYVLANHETVRRGILLSFLAALIQALSAIAIVGILAIALSATRVEINAAEGWIETISWALVALIGAWLLYSQIAAIARRRSAASAAGNHAHSHSHHTHANDGHEAHAHAKHAHRDHGHACCGHDHGHSHAHAHAHEGHTHEHHHDHGHAHAPGETCCGHAHMPDPSELKGDLTWSKALAIAFSVGIRPCTGAILILVFALSQGLLMAGVFATFAMAFGTALTVSVLAAMAVGSRELAKRMAGGEGRLANAVASGIGIGGAALVLVLGVSFFIGSLGPQGPL